MDCFIFHTGQLPGGYLHTPEAARPECRFLQFFHTSITAYILSF
jgi:hypothetical protein